MTIEINSPKLTSSVATYGAFAIRKSDGFIWNNVAGAWQATPTDADAFIALTDRGGVNAGLYRGSNSGDMGDAGLVEITMHDSASSYALVAGTGAGTITVMGGDEVQTALVGSPMTLAADAVNAAALATDAVAEIADKITTDHGSGSYVDSGAGGDATLANQTAILAKINAGPIAYVGPNLPDGSITLIEGDAYTDDTVPLSWTVANWTGPNVGTLTVGFALQLRSTYKTSWDTPALQVAGTVAMSGQDAVFTVELTAAQTAALIGETGSPFREYRFQLFWTAAGETVTQKQGHCLVQRMVRS